MAHLELPTIAPLRQTRYVAPQVTIRQVSKDRNSERSARLERTRLSSIQSLPPRVAPGLGYCPCSAGSWFGVPLLPSAAREWEPSIRPGRKARGDQHEAVRCHCPHVHAMDAAVLHRQNEG